MDYKQLISNGNEVVTSKIDGDFEGFDNEQLFPLENGQQWIQKNNKYWSHYSYDVNVTIYEYNYDHFLTIEDQEEFIEVELK